MGQIIPAVADLERAYSLLLHASPSPPTALELSLFSQWSRFDPRLGEIWVSFLAQAWHKINPIELRQSLLLQPWPASAAVLLEFTARCVAATAKQSVSSHLYPLWSRTVTEGLAKGNWEQFFIGLRSVGGQGMRDDARFSFYEYRRWGYLGREVLINKGSPPHASKETETVPTHSLLPETRQEILRALLAVSPRITTDLYWNAIHRCVSRRQAERDLKQNPLIKASGHTKGRYFLKRQRL